MTARDRSNRKCLLRLKDNGLIERLKVFHTHRVTGAFYQDAVNILTRAGAQLVQEHYDAAGSGQRVRWRPDLKRLTNATLDHELAINDLAIAAHRACWERRWELHDWHDDDLLARRTTAFDGFIPDGFGVVDTGTRLVPVFVEIDRGTETVASPSGSTKDWRTKIERYLGYLNHRFRDDPLLATLGYRPATLDRPLVLTVTTSETRLENMLAATAAVGGDHRFLFTTGPAIFGERGRFWAPVWRSPEQVAAVSLGDLLAFGTNL